MGLHYVTFIGRALKTKKKLMPVWRMNSKNIVNVVGIFNDSYFINISLIE